jgi:predicted GIY-YIG superfamily endonuclease
MKIKKEVFKIINYDDFKLSYYVYAWIRNKDWLYVGLSKNVHQRIFDHNVIGIEEPFQITDKILLFNCSSKDEMCLLEKQLIRENKPKYNKYGYIIKEKIPVHKQKSKEKLIEEPIIKDNSVSLKTITKETASKEINYFDPLWESNKNLVKEYFHLQKVLPLVDSQTHIIMDNKISSKITKPRIKISLADKQAAMRERYTRQKSVPIFSIPVSLSQNDQPIIKPAP